MRKCFKWMGSLGLALVLGVVSGCSGTQQSSGAAQPTPAQTGTEQKPADAKADQPIQKGGVIKVAIDADPATLDWMSSPASATTTVAYHIFEQLFALDQNLTVKPMLAKEYKVSDDHKTYTIQLREGVKFQDDSTMVADDVVASMKRWGTLSGVGRGLFTKIADVKATGEHAVEIKLKEPYAPLITNLAETSQAMAVMPAKIANAAGKNPIDTDKLIGTGPYQFDSWKRGQQIVLKRFDGYVSRDEDWGGLAGKKVAYADQIELNVVKDTQVRLSGLQTGQFDYAVRMPKDLYDQLNSLPGVKPEITRPDSWITVVPDKSQPPFNDVRLRQAINYALNKEQIGLATYGPPEFFEMDGSIFFPDQKDLYTKEGTESYNAYNPEKAKQLMKEAGYNGEPLKMVATNSFDDHYHSAQVVMQQLKDVGFNVDLQFFEWATFLNTVTEENKGKFDLFVTGFPPAYDLTGVLWIAPSFPGWYQSEKMSALVNQWTKTLDPAEQKRLLGEVNKTFYEEVPVIKMVNEIGLEAISDRLQGNKSWLSYRFWNVGISAGLN